MLVAIGVSRESGTLDLITNGLKFGFSFIGINTEFVDALPTALMKPLSGSGSRSMMVETMSTYGADSFVGHLSSVFQGSTETNFYLLAVYLGSVNIKISRYAVTAGLIADLVGVIAEILLLICFSIETGETYSPKLEF